MSNPEVAPSHPVEQYTQLAEHLSRVIDQRTKLFGSIGSGPDVPVGRSAADAIRVGETRRIVRDHTLNFLQPKLDDAESTRDNLLRAEEYRIQLATSTRNMEELSSLHAQGLLTDDEYRIYDQRHQVLGHRLSADAGLASGLSMLQAYDELAATSVDNNTGEVISQRRMLPETDPTKLQARMSDGLVIEGRSARFLNYVRDNPGCTTSDITRGLYGEDAKPNNIWKIVDNIGSILRGTRIHVHREVPSHGLRNKGHESTYRVIVDDMAISPAAESDDPFMLSDLCVIADAYRPAIADEAPNGLSLLDGLNMWDAPDTYRYYQALEGEERDNVVAQSVSRWGSYLNSAHHDLVTADLRERGMHEVVDAIDMLRARQIEMWAEADQVNNPVPELSAQMIARLAYEEAKRLKREGGNIPSAYTDLAVHHREAILDAIAHPDDHTSLEEARGLVHTFFESAGYDDAMAQLAKYDPIVHAAISQLVQGHDTDVSVDPALKHAEPIMSSGRHQAPETHGDRERLTGQRFMHGDAVLVFEGESVLTHSVIPLDNNGYGDPYQIEDFMADQDNLGPDDRVIRAAFHMPKGSALYIGREDGTHILIRNIRPEKHITATHEARDWGRLDVFVGSQVQERIDDAGCADLRVGGDNLQQYIHEDPTGSIAVGPELDILIAFKTATTRAELPPRLYRYNSDS